MNPSPLDPLSLKGRGEDPSKVPLLPLREKGLGDEEWRGPRDERRPLARLNRAMEN